MHSPTPNDPICTAVDDVRGVILDVEVTTGEANEGGEIEGQADAVAATTGTAIKTITTDQGYAYGKVYGALERRGIDPVIPRRRRSRSAAGCPCAGSATMPGTTS